MQKRYAKTHFLTACCLIATLIFAAIPATDAFAATAYSGSGTMADPYLVQTAEQLQGMRDNLSAHYKLANTIDLAGMDFKPVGRLDAPFTGSFVCELNGDLTPKYIVKNLKISVASSSYGAEKKNKWEAALFGATNGATISGIYVLDASISNQVLGDNQGSVSYGNYKPGMDEMNSAILIGDAESTSVSNCGTTGTISTRSNHCAGLIGYAKNCSIENSYSTANVMSEGKWNIGGLIGTAKRSTVSYCYATGNVKGSQSHIGSLIGSVIDTTITDCYAMGTASGGREDKNAFAVQVSGTSATMKNCFTLGKVDVATDKGDNPLTVANCWALTGNLHNTSKFTEGSLAQIKSAFAGLDGWDASGNQPQLKTMGIVTDASKYVPGAVQETTGMTTTPEETVTPGETTTIIEGTSSAHTAEEVATMIEALPNPDEEHPLTIDDKEAVKEAYYAYEALSAGEKDEVATELSAKLANLRYQISILIAGELVTALGEMPEIDEMTPEYCEQILALWDDFEFLDEKVVAELDQEFIDKMNAAHEYALAHEGQIQGVYQEIDTGLNTMEKIVVIVCAIVIAMAVTFDVVAGIWFIRKKKGAKRNEQSKNN